MWSIDEEITRHGADPSVLRSTLQKAIRNADADAAVPVACEMMASGWTNAVIERLKYVCQEDIGHIGRANINRLYEFHRKHKSHPNVWKEVIRWVIICCESRHSHSTAWLNMLSLRWEFEVEIFSSEEDRIEELLEKFKSALDSKDIKTALVTGSAIDLVSRIIFDSKIAKSYASLFNINPCTQQDKFGLFGTRSKISKTPIVTVYNMLFERSAPYDRIFIRNCLSGASRLELVNAILTVVEPGEPDEVIEPSAEVVERFVSLMKPLRDEAEPQNLLRCRELLPPALPFIDKHTSFAKHDQRSYLEKILNKYGIEMSPEQIGHTHPRKKDIPSVQISHNYFVSNLTQVKNPNSFDNRYREEGTNVYLTSDGTAVRARDFYYELVRKISKPAKKIRK